MLLDVKLVMKETDKAFLMKFRDRTQAWVPKSQIEGTSVLCEGTKDTCVMVSDWRVEKMAVEPKPKPKPRRRRKVAMSDEERAIHELFKAKAMESIEPQDETH